MKLEENKLKLIKEALTDQKNVFGDSLFTQISLSSVQEETKEVIFENKNPVNVVMEKEPSLIEEEFKNAKNLEELNSLICECQKCPLGKTRTKFVFGVGNPNADVMIIGEAPGADEDRQGEPFVGRAGKLLNDILKAIHFEREEVFIANILKCRPPGNRNPLPSEMEICIPYLHKQIELIKPKLILSLGLVSATGLLKQKLSLTQMRGNVYELNGVKVMVTYHPAALLRNPNWKRGCWEDVQKFRKLYDELKSK